MHANRWSPVVSFRTTVNRCFCQESRCLSHLLFWACACNFFYNPEFRYNVKHQGHGKFCTLSTMSEQWNLIAGILPLFTPFSVTSLRFQISLRSVSWIWELFVCSLFVLIWQDFFFFIFSSSFIWNTSLSKHACVSDTTSQNLTAARTFQRLSGFVKMCLCRPEDTAAYVVSVTTD